MREWHKFLLILLLFLICYFFPLGILGFNGPVFEALALVQWYAREHVLLCLVPAFFIAGGISVFLSRESVIRYLGPDAPKPVAYGIASVSGTILAVCSCTILPLFSGIHKRGAGLGPATAFLYSGPAINILAIIMTARILGWELGIARALGAVVFSILIGILMQLIFKKEESRSPEKKGFVVTGDTLDGRSLQKNILYFLAMIAILVFANWGAPQPGDQGLWAHIFQLKWALTAGFMVLLGYMIVRWFKKAELAEWTLSSWGFAKQILPLLFLGVLFAGVLLGRPGQQGLIPHDFIEGLVGGNSLLSNIFASVIGAFMYFATLTEVPILEGLIGAGMGKGPALALLLAGPALSLPNMLVIRGVIGTRKTLVYVGLVIIMATASGMIYGGMF